MRRPTPRIETEGEPVAPAQVVEVLAAPSIDAPPRPAPRVETEGEAVAPVRVAEMAAALPTEIAVVRPAPRIEVEGGRSGRLDAPELVVPVVRAARWGMPALALAGFSVLAVGFSGLWAANFVSEEFARSEALGWATLGVAAAGFGLLLAGVAREVAGLLALRAVDRLRRDLAGGDAVRRARAALEWVGGLPEGEALRPALRGANDPDAILALLRAGPEAMLRAQADALGRRAALQVVAGMAATPAPALVVLLVTWRGLRLIRQVAAVYGLRPGVVGTLGLLRRTALAATATAVVEVAVNTAAHAVLSTPLLTHLAGEMAGGAVAARRMVVLARAAAVACSPVPRE